MEGVFALRCVKRDSRSSRSRLENYWVGLRSERMLLLLRPGREAGSTWQRKRCACALCRARHGRVATSGSLTQQRRFQSTCSQ